ncbi:MAG: hypothetical protein BWZ02_01141 [Lentisphaerae bacterium ADurb.BinA184]|nr:MAG: hypothetical protein BWZ02_01141 [Lentisphaerae bacterium ADurb.BinA184]
MCAPAPARSPPMLAGVPPSPAARPVGHRHDGHPGLDEFAKTADFHELAQRPDRARRTGHGIPSSRKRRIFANSAGGGGAAGHVSAGGDDGRAWLGAEASFSRTRTAARPSRTDGARHPKFAKTADFRELGRRLGGRHGRPDGGMTGAGMVPRGGVVFTNSHGGQAEPDGRGAAPQVRENGGFSRTRHMAAVPLGGGKGNGQNGMSRVSGSRVAWGLPKTSNPGST